MMQRDLVDIEQSVMIPSRHGHLMGTLYMVGEACHGVVLIAHASDDVGYEQGQAVAQELQRAHVSTLQVGLLTIDDMSRGAGECDCAPVDRLAEHLVEATDWLEAKKMFRDLPLGYFGMDSGGAAALIAAAERPDHVVAVATCDARMDLADQVLDYVHAPVLLMVNERDYELLSRSEEAATRLRSDRQVAAVHSADVVSRGTEWLKRYVAADMEEEAFEDDDAHENPYGAIATLPALGRTH